MPVLTVMTTRATTAGRGRSATKRFPNADGDAQTARSSTVTPMAEKPRPRVVSGIQPTGQLMIGNYIGAVKSWVELQATHESFFFLADLHAITVPQDAADLRQRSLEVVAILMACGVDPEQSVIFLQSHVPAHTQLLWVLNCAVPMGELQRMTQFKEKAGRNRA